MTTVTRRTTTCATCRTEHACTLFSVLVTITWHTHNGSSRPWVCQLISTYHPWWAFLSELLDFSLYVSPHFLVFFLSFFSMYSDNFDSVTNNLHDSAKGSFITDDDTFPLTCCVRKSDPWLERRWRPGDIRAVDGFSPSSLYHINHSNGTHVVLGEGTTIQATFRPDCARPEILSNML